MIYDLYFFDSIMNPFASYSSMNSIATLLFQSPPKMPLYVYIVSGTPEEVLRKKYSYAIQYPVTGTVSEFAGSICTVTNGATMIYTSIDSLWLEPRTLVACNSREQFDALYPEFSSWITLMLPNGQYVARPPLPSEVMIPDYLAKIYAKKRAIIESYPDSDDYMSD